MEKLLIIADDFTGALDTGIQFTKMGTRTRVVAQCDYKFQNLKSDDILLAVNTDTRPLSPQEAYERVYTLARNAKIAGFQHVYKKTDSGFRGNIGMELKAVMDAYEQTALVFVPALPKLNRTTVNGIQYIDGVPVKESVFGKDPFEPVMASDVAEIIQSQTDLQVVKVPKTMYEKVDFTCEEQTVFVFDAETEADLVRIAQILRDKDTVIANAGCAGFAEVYTTVVPLAEGNLNEKQPTDGLLVLCGSVNQITIDQLDDAEKKGFRRRWLCNEQKLNPLFGQTQKDKAFLQHLYDEICTSDRYLIDTLDHEGFQSVAEYCEKEHLQISDIRFSIAHALGVVAAELVKKGLNYTIAMTGGDTLMGFMKAAGVNELSPVCEIGKGAVLSKMNWNGKELQIISKSGGFGEVQIFTQMYETVKEI